MNVLQNITKGSAIKGSATLIILAGAFGLHLASRGLLGYTLHGLPLWCFGLVASTGGVLHFLGPMIYGSESMGGAKRLPKGSGELLFLYLRPFELDARNFWQLVVGASAGILIYADFAGDLLWTLGFLPLVASISKEQSLGDALGPLGRFVAFGSPGERLRPLGASRIYAKDDWQREVDGYLSKARLVIVRPGVSPSIRWEVEQVLRTVPRERVLFYLRFRGLKRSRAKTYELFRQQVWEVCRKELPEHPLSRYMTFDSRGNPSFISEDFRPAALARQSVSLSGDVFKDRLRPVFKAVGVELPPAPGGLFYKLMSALPWLVALPAMGLMLLAVLLALFRITAVLLLFLLRRG